MKKLLLFTFGLMFLAACNLNLMETKTTPSKIYKLIPEASYDKSNQESCIQLTDLDLKSGFIHTAFEHQIQQILKKFFKGQGKMLAVELDVNILKTHNVELKPESNKPGGEIFPHLYGEQKIPLPAVTKVIEYQEQADGTWITN